MDVILYLESYKGTVDEVITNYILKRLPDGELTERDVLKVIDPKFTNATGTRVNLLTVPTEEEIERALLKRDKQEEEEKMMASEQESSTN
mmetsp:Transcript_2425/g.2375  ORF Transcript_2425/g.2375 Transcript_2425/m.2375 type:complete len:90 (+) Transcript_2425:564-833(+)